MIYHISIYQGYKNNNNIYSGDSKFEKQLEINQTKMQYSSLDIQSLTELLGSVGQFSLNSEEAAATLSKMSLSQVKPLVNYLAHILTLPPQNKKVLPSILALRLIKQTIILGSYQFYTQVVVSIIPILYQYFNHDSSSSGSIHEKYSNLQEFKSTDRCLQLLKQKWFMLSGINLQHSHRLQQNDILSNPEINSCGNYLQLIYQFMRWMANIADKHPSSSPLFQYQHKFDNISYSSIFKIIENQNKSLFSRNLTYSYKFFKQQSMSTFTNNIYKRSTKSLEALLRYCESFTEQYIITKSTKSLKKLHQLIYYTADSQIINSIIMVFDNTIQQHIQNRQNQQKSELSQYLSRAIQIGRLKIYDNAGTNSNLLDNQYDYDELQYYTRVILLFAPELKIQIFEQNNSTDDNLFKSLVKLKQCIFQINNQMDISQLHLMKIVDRLLQSAQNKLTITFKNIGNDFILKNMYRKLPINQINILKTTNIEKYPGLISNYQKKLQYILQEIQQNQQNYLAKSKNVSNQYIPDNVVAGDNLKNKYRLDHGVYNPDQPESYIEYDPKWEKFQKKIQAFSKSKPEKKSQKYQKYEIKSQGQSLKKKSDKSISNGIGGSSELSSKIYQRIQLKRLATQQRSKFQEQNRVFSSLSQPQRNLIQQTSYQATQVNRKSNINENFRKKHIVRKNSDEISRGQSLTDRLKRRTALKSRKSISSQNHQTNIQELQPSQKPEQEVMKQYFTLNKKKQPEGNPQKHGTISFFNHNDYQQKSQFIQNNQGKNATDGWKGNNPSNYNSQKVSYPKYNVTNLGNIDTIAQQISPKQREKGKQSFKSNLYSSPKNTQDRFSLNNYLQFQSVQRSSPNQDLISSKKSLLKPKTQKKIQIRNQKKRLKDQRNQDNNRILIQATLTKPAFGFRTNTTTNQKTSQGSSEQSEFQSNSDTDEIQSKQTVNISDRHYQQKSLQNFADILKDKNLLKTQLKVIKNKNLTGYIIPASSIQKKQQKLRKKIESYKKVNEIYYQKIQEKQKQIKVMNKRLQRQKDQLQGYQTSFARAYDNVYENPDSLMLHSRDNDNLGMDNLQDKVKNLKKIQIKMQGLQKKVFKQILYGKALLMENQYIQVGFNNLQKQGEVILYLQIKQNCKYANIFLKDIDQCGYSILEDEFNIVLGAIPAGKRLKFKIFFAYRKRKSFKFALMNLCITIKTQNSNTQRKFQSLLPFCLYRNFFISIKSQEKKISPQFMTEWQQGSDQFIKNKRQFLSNLFNEGIWTDESSYQIKFMFLGQNVRIKILIINKYFTIQMQNNRNNDLVETIGNLLIKQQ